MEDFHAQEKDRYGSPKCEDRTLRQEVADEEESEYDGDREAEEVLRRMGG